MTSRALILNNSGIGNALVALPVLGALEREGSLDAYFHIENPAFQAPYLLESAQIRRLAGTVPAIWRRFAPAAVEQMLEFCRSRSIDLVLNLRIDDPALDGAYFEAKRRFIDAKLRCVDLYEADGQLGPTCSIYERMDRALRAAGLLRSHVPRVWLPRVKREPSQRPLGFYLGVSQAIKRWPSESWARLLEQVCQHSSAGLRLFAGQSDFERAFAARVLHLLPHYLGERVELVGGAPLEEVCRLLGECSLIVSHDTFAVHAAEALGVPCLGLFLATNGDVWGPRSVRERAVVARSSTLASCALMKPNGTCAHYYTAPEACRCRHGLSVESVTDCLLPILRGGRVDVDVAAS